MAYTPPKTFKESGGQAFLDEEQARLDALKKEQQASNTAMAPGTEPTQGDLSRESEITGINQNLLRLRGKQASESWYGPRKTEDTFSGGGSQQSIAMKALNGLSVPLYATAGAVEGALGLGSKRGILDNINANVKEREGFGNILQRSGMSGYGATPLGFMLDVMFDPVNWATVGVGALIPRLAFGLGKGGVKGLASGAVSRLAPAGLKTANILSLNQINRSRKTADLLKLGADGLSANGIVPSKMAKFSASIGNAANSVAKAGAKAGATYDESIGRTILKSKSGVSYGKDLLRQTLNAEGDMVGKPGFKSYFGNEKIFSLGSAVEDLIPHGSKIMQVLKYSPSNWARMKRIESEVIRQSDRFEKETGIAFIPKTREETERLRALGPEGRRAAIAKHVEGAPMGGVDAPPGFATDFPEGGAENIPGVNKAREAFNDGASFANEIPEWALSKDSAEIMKRMVSEAIDDVNIEDINEIIRKIKSGMNEQVTGIKSYDNLVSKMRETTMGDIPGIGSYLNNYKIKDTKYMGSMMDAYSSFMSLFKWAKVPMSFSSHTNAIFGNLTMSAMAGFDITDPKLRSRMAQTISAMRGKGGGDSRLIANMMKTPHWAEYAKRDPRGFAGTFNFSFDKIAEQGRIAEAVATAGAKEASIIGGAGKETAEELGKRAAMLKEENATIAPMMKGFNNPIELEMSSFVNNDLNGGNSNSFTRMKDKLQKEVFEGKAGSSKKLANWMLTKPTEAFGSYDTTFRITHAVHLTEDGINEASMKIMSKTFGIREDDILDVVIDAATGEKKFKIKPEKATEMAGEIFLNYAAMPAIVKVLRTLPILGAPFAAFTYGMATRTGKTALYNPAIFNKVNFLMQEVSGDRGPAEKESMKSKYYSWFSDPGMVKIPIATQYPLYANLTSMIPYYSMNMFTPSERKYEATLPNSVLALLDKFPILQTPEGQLMFDYIIQPMLLEKGQQAQGSFGQALHPLDATGVEKFGYAARQLGESVVPGAVGVAAFLGSQGLTPEQINKIPSYNYRKIAQAMKGNSVLGIPGKENNWPKSFRALLSTVGVPLHRMDTSFVDGKQKEK